MGVRGLTSYIAKNADKYLQPYELHDTKLIIDGDNLSSNLYKWYSKCNSAFGGDYDQYYRYCKNFYHMLKQCNVEAYVLMDGGYQRKKLKTVYQRLRSKIGAIKYLNPYNAQPLFPLMMREVFIEATLDSKIPLMRCIFEADDEVAILGNKLNCPILSYDSDFYIFNVKYIPLITLTFKVYKKVNKCNNSTNNNNKNSSKHNKKKFKKYLISENLDDNIIDNTKQLNSDYNKNSEDQFHYMDCCLYTIENLIESDQLNDNMLPLFAILLGNDYINRTILGKFFTNVNIKRYSRHPSKHHQRITSILKWLKYETIDSAIAKILKHNKQTKHSSLFKEITKAMMGYNIETSESMNYFGFKEIDIVNQQTFNFNLEEYNEDEHDDDNAEDDDDDVIDDEENETEIDDDDNDVNDEQNDIESVINSEVEDEQVDEGENVKSENCDLIDNESDNENTNNNRNKLFELPNWLVENFKNGQLPRFIIDLLHLKMYINAPQIENFLLTDANQISIDILLLIFTILHYPKRPQLKYLTRVVRLTNVHSKKMDCINNENNNNNEIIEKFLIDNNDKDFKLFKLVFANFPNSDQLFHRIIDNCSKQLQLFILSLLYWLKRSRLINECHIHSMFLCFIVLNIIDEKIEAIRDPNVFHKKYNQIFKKTSSSCSADSSTSSTIQSPSLTAPTSSALPSSSSSQSLIDISNILKFITKSECILVQENLLQYFQINEKCLRKRHTETSNTILHCFAEFQSIFYQLNTFNNLLNKPFEQLKISKLYSGHFLFNIYNNLKDRPNILHYLRYHIYKNSITLYNFHNQLTEFINSFNLLKIATTNGKLAFRKLKNKRNKRKMQQHLINEKIKNNIDEPTNNMCADDVDGDESDDSYNDINNKFASLLKL